MSLSDVIFRCRFWVPFSDVTFGCHFPMSLLGVIFRCRFRMSFSDVTFGCHFRLPFSYFIFGCRLRQIYFCPSIVIVVTSSDCCLIPFYTDCDWWPTTVNGIAVSQNKKHKKGRLNTTWKKYNRHNKPYTTIVSSGGP